MILILGAGFIGLSLYNFLKSVGFEVKIFSRKLQPDIAHYPNIEGQIESILDYPEVFYGVKTIIHAIHTTVPATSGINPVHDIQSNVIPLINILNASQNFGVENLIYISSGGAVYGNQGDQKVNETHCCKPVSSYGITKLMCENYLRINHIKLKNTTIILRPSNVYGLGQNLYKPQGVVGHILKSAKDGKNLEVWGNGDSLKDYLHINDFVESVYVLLQNLHKVHGYEVFNVGSQQLFSVNQIINFVEKVSGKPILKVYAQEKDFDVKSVNIDSTKFREKFGWQTKKDFYKEVGRMIEEKFI